MLGEHDCPGLAVCAYHPRWHVWRSNTGWVAWPPGDEVGISKFGTWGETMEYVLEQYPEEKSNEDN